MRIAIAQTPGTSLEHWRETLTLIESVVRRAADQSAELVVLPECVWPAYVLGSPQCYTAARRAGLPDHNEFLEHLRQYARAAKIAVCAGYVEETPNELANAACLIDADGQTLGQHRKCFLWDFDRECFTAGGSIEPIDTPWGRIGLMICADARLPEIPATLAARGARLLLQPTGWVNAGAPERLWNPQPEFLVPSRAREFGIPIASASKWGVEGETTFVGSSIICDEQGHVVAHCGTSETAVVTADVELSTPRPPQMTPQQREILSGPCSPNTPSRDVPPLPVMLLPASAGGGAELEASRKRIADGAVLCVSPSHGTNGHADDYLLLATPADGVFELGPARVAAVSAADVCSFAPIRCFALGGIHLAVVFGDDVEQTLVRSRACENRVFLVWARTAGVSVIDPRGQVIAERAWPSTWPTAPAITLDLAAAADKCVTRNTDVIAGRRPAQYAL